MENGKQLAGPAEWLFDPDQCSTAFAMSASVSSERIRVHAILNVACGSTPRWQPLAISALACCSELSRVPLVNAD
jgi:hypothetical protein